MVWRHLGEMACSAALCYLWWIEDAGHVAAGYVFSPLLPAPDASAATLAAGALDAGARAASPAHNPPFAKAK